MGRLKVAAVVVTFNRKELLNECIGSLINQTYKPSAIFVIDNCSTDGTEELLFLKGYIKSPNMLLIDNRVVKTSKMYIDGENIDFYYLRLDKNYGGTGGFYEGIKIAMSFDFDWIWIMDDDAEPLKNALEESIKYTRMNGVVAISNLEVNRDFVPINNNRGYFRLNAFIGPLIRKVALSDICKQPHYIEIDHASFVGLMVKKEVIEKVGLPKKEFFIYFDDLEYCIRIRRYGKIIMPTRSIIIHKAVNQTDIKEVNILNIVKIKRFPVTKLKNLYYGKRNYLWIKKTYSANKIIGFLKICMNFLIDISLILLLDDKKMKRIIFTCQAYFDAIFDRFEEMGVKK